MTCHNAVLEAWPEAPFAQRLKETPRNYDTLSKIPCLSCLIPVTYYHIVIGEVVSHIMPLLMMRQQRVPRNKWTSFATDRGKKWIEKVFQFLY